MPPRIRRELRLLLWGWTIVVSAGATIGGIIGWISVDNDTQ